MTPFLLILSSPSGGGKTTIAKTLLAARDDVGYSVSATTRRPRPGEQNGVDYLFLSPEEFAARRDAGAFLEWAEYGAHWYGTLESEIQRVLSAGRHVLLDIEVQGARLVRQRRSDVVSIFVLPPSAHALLERLGGRNTDRPVELKRRLGRAVEELDDVTHYDYVVVNADRTQAVAEVAAIIDAETRRPHRQPSLLEQVSEIRRDLSRIAQQLPEA